MDVSLEPWLEICMETSFRALRDDARFRPVASGAVRQMKRYLKLSELKPMALVGLGSMGYSQNRTLVRTHLRKGINNKLITSLKSASPPHLNSDARHRSPPASSVFRSHTPFDTPSTAPPPFPHDTKSPKYPHNTSPSACTH